MPDAVVRAASTVLAHAPGLALHGSKPSRTLARDPDGRARFVSGLRSYDEALRYPPHQAFLGTCHPRELPQRPWVDETLPGAKRFAPFGEFLPEQALLAVMALVDEFGLLTLAPELAESTSGELACHPLAAQLDLPAISLAAGDVVAAVEKGALPLHLPPDNLVAALRAAHEEDEALTAPVLLENLACKATGTLALLHLLHDNELDPVAVQYTISCSEEAVGDRYQRGGGNMGKAIAAAAGLHESSGADVKNFCAAPVPALV
ncbi:MAG: glycine/sarcosine/betaine reductase complex component C subunit beta, partial [Gemmatimonadales bacterium]